MGNAVGPVTLIALGIFIGYLVLTNRGTVLRDLVSGKATTSPATAPNVPVSLTAASVYAAGGAAT